MALQEVCGYNSNSYVYPKWNILAPASQEHTHLRSFFTGSSGSPLELYVPVADYLEESPLQFGQASPNVMLQSAARPDNCVFPCLPLPTPIPLSASSSIPLPFQLSHGTTTLAFQFQGGVIAAADTRSSCSGLVACPASQKILPIHSHLVGTTSGTSADCALWKRILARELRLYQLRHHRRLSTGGAAKLLSHMLHPFKGTELCVAATLCGWDGGDNAEAESTIFSQPVKKNQQETMEINAVNLQQKLSGPRLFYVCSDGTRLQGELFSVGSGSPYAYSILDRDVCWEMSVDEAVGLAREAVFRATHRDAYSGNNVDLYHITARGWKRRDREELKEEYYNEKAREREMVAERRRKMDESRM